MTSTVMKVGLRSLRVTQPSHLKVCSLAVREVTRRELLAASNQDQARVAKYQQRKSLLQEMLTYLHHANYEEYEKASSMLHLVDVLSSDEDSPSGPNGHQVNTSQA